MNYTIGPVQRTPYVNFEVAIKDVKFLLHLHDSETGRSPGKPSESLEVFKRAGVIITVTAWETYIEDTVTFQFQKKLENAKTPDEFSHLINAVSQDWYDRIIEKKADRPKPSDFLSWCGDGWKKILLKKLNEDISHLNTPNSKNIAVLFKRYLDLNLNDVWRWRGNSPQTARKKLDEMINLRGALTHRSRDFLRLKLGVRRRDLVNSIELVERLASCIEKNL